MELKAGELHCFIVNMPRSGENTLLRILLTQLTTIVRNISPDNRAAVDYYESAYRKNVGKKISAFYVSWADRAYKLGGPAKALAALNLVAIKISYDHVCDFLYFLPV